MNSKAKTISSIAAAVALGTGVVVYEATTSNNSSSQNETIDWETFDLNVPKLDVPTLDVPNIGTVGIDVPKIGMPEVNVPELEVVAIDDTSINAPSYGVPELEVVTIDIAAIDAPSYDVPEIFNFTEDFSNAVENHRKVNAMMIDTRTALNTNIINNKFIEKWIKIYEDFKETSSIAYVPIEKNFKMIAEVCVPKTYAEISVLNENLLFYKSEGYDSVLVTFTLDDDPRDVINTVKYIRNKNDIDVWLAYAGKESTIAQVFGDPDKYKAILKTCAPYIYGYVNSWRRTSSHLWKQDDAFMNFTNTVLRSSNPGIKIIGELYYGTSYRYEDGNPGFETNIFTNASGIMIVNFGYSRIEHKLLMKKIIKPRIGNMKPIGVVVGSTPYYLTTNPNKMTAQQNIAAKHFIEDKFMQNGCIGTITFQDDGSNRNEMNNLCKTLHTNLTSK